MSLFSEVIFASKEEQDQLMRLAIGRLFQLMSRPQQKSDIATYERCRAIVLDVAEAQEMDMSDRAPNYVRDRHKGAAGD